MYIWSCGKGGMYREKRKNRRFCTYEAVVRGGHLQREKEKEEVMYIWSCGEGGACTERKGKRGGYEHMKL